MQKSSCLIFGVVFLMQSMGLLIVPSICGQQVPTISAAGALAKYNSGKVIILDAMNSRTYKKYHILGALSLPGDGKADLDRIERAKLPIPKSQDIIVYCD